MYPSYFLSFGSIKQHLQIAVSNVPVFANTQKLASNSKHAEQIALIGVFCSLQGLDEKTTQRKV